MTKKSSSCAKICLNLLLKLVTLMLPAYLASSVLCVLSDPSDTKLEAVDVLTNCLGPFVDGGDPRSKAPPSFRARDGAKDVTTDDDGGCTMFTGPGSPERVRKRPSAHLSVPTRSSKMKHTVSPQAFTRTESSERNLANPHQGVEQRSSTKRIMDFDLNRPVEELEEEEVHHRIDATDPELTHLGKTCYSREELSKTAGIAATEKQGQTIELKGFGTGKALSPMSDRLPTSKAAFDLNFPPEDISEAVTHEATPNDGAAPAVAIPKVVDAKVLNVIERPHSYKFLQQDDERPTNVEIIRTAKIATVSHPDQINLVGSRGPQSQGSGSLLIHESSPLLSPRPKFDRAPVHRVGTQATPSKCFIFPGSSKGLEVEIHEYPGVYESFRKRWLPAYHCWALNRQYAIREAGYSMGDAVLKNSGCESREKHFIRLLEGLPPISSNGCCKPISMPADIDTTIKMAMNKIHLILYHIFAQPLFTNPDMQKKVFEEAHKYVISYCGSFFDPKCGFKEYTRDFRERSTIASYQNRRHKAESHFSRITTKEKAKQAGDYNAFAWALVQDWMQTQLGCVYNKMRGLNDLHKLFKCLVDDYAIALSGAEFEVWGQPPIRFEFKKVFKIQNP